MGLQNIMLDQFCLQERVEGFRAVGIDSNTLIVYCMTALGYWLSIVDTHLFNLGLTYILVEIELKILYRSSVSISH